MSSFLKPATLTLTGVLGEEKSYAEVNFPPDFNDTRPSVVLI